MAARDENSNAKVVITVAGLLLLGFIAFLDGQPNFEVNPLVYYIIGGAVLGTADFGKLINFLSGIRFDGNNKKDK